jgi:magnesium chelatase family protein
LLGLLLLEQAPFAWASPEMEIIAAGSLIQLANHFRGNQVLLRPKPKIREVTEAALDLRDIKGQESAKRALEIGRRADTICFGYGVNDKSYALGVGV